VLDRAGVSRSTFYVHYRDKDDLFLSDVEEFFDAMSTLLSKRGELSDRVVPLRELFAHVAEWRQFYDALVSSGKIQDVLELGQGQFARGIEQRLAELPRSRNVPAEERVVAAQAYSGALVTLMRWWLDSASRLPVEQMDDLYHRMVWGGLAV
jgi:AcrR family transcriptional regulator